jgi:Core-2/I-Branching enzyme
MLMTKFFSAAYDSPPTRVQVSPGDGRSTRARTPLKLAYLIMAHQQPTHLARLIRALDQDNSVFFIHIDAKVPLAPFTAVVPQSDNLLFLPHRVEVHWGTVSVVQAALQLIYTAMASGHPFTYYILLSGSDYPIKDKQAISVHFQDSQRQYIRIDRPLTRAGDDRHAYRLQNLPQGKYFGHLTPYHGSMYWSLTTDCIRFILDFVHDNPGYLELHQHIFAPDEVFFHTLVKHSPFAAAVTHDFANGIYPDHTHHGTHFIDWAGLRTRNYLTLDERDFADLLASEALFARKFDEHTSRKLLDLLDAHVHGW